MIIYLAQPYSINADESLKEERYQKGVKKVAELIKQGYNVISPILLSHEPSKQYDLPSDFDYWERVDKELILCCDEVWVLMLEEWESSKGIKAEVAFAKENGMTVKYIEENV